MKTQHRAGGACLELVVILPLLITLSLGCVDFGRFAHVLITLVNAAQAGISVAAFNPRTAATASLWEEKVRQAVQEEMADVPGFDNTKLVVTVELADDEGTLSVRLMASYPFQTVVDWPGIPRQTMLRRTLAAPSSRL